MCINCGETKLDTRPNLRCLAFGDYGVKINYVYFYVFDVFGTIVQLSCVLLYVKVV